MASADTALPATRDSMSLEPSQIFQTSMLAPENMVHRWDGNGRTATEWNALRKDTELWFEDGNCYVYLYQPGKSLRGPSFCVPVDMLVEADCNDLLDEHLISSSNTNGSGIPAVGEECFLFLPAPSHLSRDGAFQYHLDTRNFFAWLVGAPLVGTDPSLALSRLKDRLDAWRDPLVDNGNALIEYVQGQGYCDVDQPLEKSFGDFDASALPMPRKRKQSLKSWLRRPASSWRSSKMVDPAKKRASILGFATPLWGRTLDQQPSIGPLEEFDEFAEFDRHRNSESWSNRSPPQLTHSVASTESLYSVDYVSSPSSPITPTLPDIPTRSSSFEKTKLDTGNGDSKQGGLKFYFPSEEQEDTIESLIQEIEQGRTAS